MHEIEVENPPREETPPPEYSMAERQETSERHAMKSWTTCYEDSCPIHLQDKEGADWFPRKYNAPATLDNGKAECMALTADAIHVRTSHYRYLQCGDPYCKKTGNHEHLAYDPAAGPQEKSRIIRLRFCHDTQCPNYTPGMEHIHQGERDPKVPMTEVSLDPETQPEMSMSQPAEEPRYGPATADHYHVLQIFGTCEERGVLTPKYDETIDQNLLYGYYSCRTERCLLRSIPHVHQCHYDPAEMDRLGMTREEAQAALSEQGAECKKDDCPSPSNHLHWPKNE
jgi:hypothetical protein